MRESKTRILTFCAIAIVANIILGISIGASRLPLYLDTIGTVFVAVIFGPWYGAAVGGLTSVLKGMLFNPKSIPFMLVSIAIGLIVGFIARKFKFNLATAIITGLITSIVAPLIGTPIGIFVYGGLTGTVSDVFVLWLKQSGMSIFTASFIPKVFNNFLDKMGTCILVYFMIKFIPKRYLISYKK